MPETRSSHPEEVGGGCLCGSVRYTISFNDEQWPPKPSNCQCTTCRKWTSALVSHALLIGRDQLSDITKQPTYVEYESTPGNKRGFCSKCGSSLIWMSDKMQHRYVLMVGTVDEEILVGKKVEGTERETKRGLEFERTKAYGKEFCTPKISMFWENVITGVTDQGHGEDRTHAVKFLQDASKELDGFH